MNQSVLQVFANAWPAIALSDLLRYLLAAGGLAAILALFRRPLARRKLQKPRASSADMRREIGHSLVTVGIFSFVGFGVYLGAQAGVFRVGAMPDPGWIALLDFALIVVAHDAWFYWIHRSMHHPKLYRRFHRVHHLSRTPTPWAAYAFAIPEAILEALFLPTYLLLFETPVVIVVAFTSHMIVRNVIGHAGTELFPRRWLDWPLLRAMTTTTHHDLHHAEFRWNYGLYFTWWDRWMGTEHPHYAARFHDSVNREQASGPAT